MSAVSRVSTLALCLGASAWAQISTGTIVGVVEDPSGAVVPNAEITVKQVDTGETRVARTTGSGEFNVPFLHIGQYSITAAAGGFKTKTLTGITLASTRRSISKSRSK